MKVSDILKARNRLQEIVNFSHHNAVFEEYFQTLHSAFLDFGFLRDHYEIEVQHKANAWRGATNAIEKDLEQAIARCNQLIEQAEQPLLRRSREVYATMLHNESDHIILDKELPVADKLYDSVFTRVGSYSNWQYPALMIRPARETIVERLVASDPLYIMDQRLSLLVPTLEKFTPEYQRRVRQYCVDEGARVFAQFPNKTFNLILAWNFFNYRPMDLVCQYITEAWDKLRPGGIMGFTFNDCEYVAATILAETDFACYTPGRLILDHVTRTGYEIVAHDTDRSRFHWLEIRKPGTLSSLRGGQCLAKIMPKY